MGMDEKYKIVDIDDLFKLTRWEEIYYPCYRFVRNIKNFFRYDIHQGIKRLIIYFPIIWRDRDWDWYFLADLMEFKLRRMQKVMERGHFVKSNKCARQIQICAELCKRLKADDIMLYYYDRRHGKPEGWYGAMCKREKHIQQFYTEYLGKIMGKYLLWWWD